MYKAEIAIDLSLKDINLIGNIINEISEKLDIDKSNIKIRKVSLKNDNVFKKKIIGEFSLEEVFENVGVDHSKKEFVVNNKVYQVRLNSKRYRLFKLNPNCVVCGLKGSKFVLEKNESDNAPHFNLYGESDGQMILMTKDHIKPKSIGGEDTLSNYQTMCSVCNNLKGNTIFSLEGMQILRKIHDENKNLLTKKELNNLISENREKLKLDKPYLWEDAKEYNIMIAKCDILICENNKNLIARSIYNNKNKDDKIVACIKKGAKIDPFMISENLIYVKFNGDKYQINQNLIDYA